jgi:hypothetical protein
MRVPEVNEHERRMMRRRGRGRVPGLGPGPSLLGPRLTLTRGFARALMGCMRSGTTYNFGCMHRLCHVRACVHFILILILIVHTIPLPPATAHLISSHLISFVFPRWRRVHGTARRHPRPRSIRAHGRPHAPSPAPRRTFSGPRRLRTARRVADQTGARGCATRAQHVLQRQDRAVGRARHTGCAREPGARTGVHPCDRAWRGRSFDAGAGPK